MENQIIFYYYLIKRIVVTYSLEQRYKYCILDIFLFTQDKTTDFLLALTLNVLCIFESYIDMKI